jgi:hypothetical protein
VTTKKLTLADFPALAETQFRLDSRKRERKELRAMLEAVEDLAVNNEEKPEARQKRIAAAVLENGSTIEEVLAIETEATRRHQDKAHAAAAKRSAITDALSALDIVIDELETSLAEEKRHAHAAMAEAAKPALASLCREFLGAIALAASVERRIYEWHAGQELPEGLLPRLELGRKYGDIIGDVMRAAVRAGLVHEDDKEILSIREEDDKLAALRPQKEEEHRNGRHFSRAEIEQIARNRGAYFAELVGR